MAAIKQSVLPGTGVHWFYCIFERDTEKDIIKVLDQYIGAHLVQDLDSLLAFEIGTGVSLLLGYLNSCIERVWVYDQNGLDFGVGKS